MAGFDHKNIFLKLGKQNFTKQERSLSNQFLCEPIIKFTILASAIKTHLTEINHQSVLNRAFRHNLQEFLRLELLKIERVRSLIKGHFEDNMSLAKNPTTELENISAAQLRLIEAELEDCANLNDLEAFEKVSDPNSFFEKLTVAVKKAGIWGQHFLFKITKELIYSKEKKVEELKKNFDANFDQIFKLEREIGKIRDTSLRDKLCNLKIFECLNAEKASPHFLTISKKSKKGC